VFVLTHYPRAPLVMQGGTTFTFVTGGPAAALERARRAADGRNVVVSGGGSTARQYLAASLLDELDIHLVPRRSWRPASGSSMARRWLGARLSRRT
jgi:dihydrofolate reductase